MRFTFVRSRRRVTATLGAGVLVLAACDADSIAGPRDVARLAAAEAKWADRSFADYTYEIRTSCYCILEVTQWVRVTVVDGAVVAAVPVEQDGWPITELTPWQPIDSLFSKLRQTMKNGSRDFYASIRAVYDPVLGYPVSIDYRAIPQIADGDRSHELRNVIAVP